MSQVGLRLLVLREEIMLLILILILGFVGLLVPQLFALIVIGVLCWIWPWLLIPFGVLLLLSD